MAAASGSYWTNTSPSSPSHILQTPHHAVVALCGGGGFIAFSFGLVGKEPFDASLGFGIVVLCLYIYTLHSERCRQKSRLREGFAGVSVLSADGRSVKASAGNRGGRAAADGTSELDLTGYATTLGVSIRNGVVHKEGSTLNKILMDALAKEYLRCVTALKSYQSAFGPLQEGLPEHSVRTVIGPQIPSMGPSHTDPLNTTINSLNLAMDLGALAESATNTPRSPTGIESPDPRRCRSRNGETTPPPLLSALEGSTPTCHAPANTPAPVEEQPQAEEPEEPEDPWSMNDVRPASPPSKFANGLFGARTTEAL